MPVHSDLVCMNLASKLWSAAGAQSCSAARMAFAHWRLTPATVQGHGVRRGHGAGGAPGADQHEPGARVAGQHRAALAVGHPAAAGASGAPACFVYVFHEQACNESYSEQASYAVLTMMGH